MMLALIALRTLLNIADTAYCGFCPTVNVLHEMQVVTCKEFTPVL